MESDFAERQCIVVRDSARRSVKKSVFRHTLHPSMSMFTSSSWLKTCQTCWPADLGWVNMSFRVASGEPAECLLGRRSLRRHGGLLGARVVALNQSLDPSWDQVFIEYNGFFGANQTDFHGQLSALLTDLTRDPEWDEFRLSGLSMERVEAACRVAHDFGLKVRQTDARPTFSRRLIDDKPSGSILTGLSSNTRAQLRKSRRLIETRLGPLKLVQAQSLGEAKQWFESLAPWHRDRWAGREGRPGSSGFDNPAFIRFHQSLIDNAFAADQIRLWRLLAGEHWLAGLYNFRIGGTEAFYLGATEPSLDPAMRAGLVAHQAVMDRCMSEGVLIYDFMAGDSQYKRQLSNHQTQLCWLVLQRPRLKFKIEDRFREMRNRLKTLLN